MKRTFTFLMSLFLAVGTMWADVNAELKSKIVSIGDAATKLTVDTWYALYNHGRKCYVSEEGTAFIMRTDTIANDTLAENVAGKLFKLIAAKTEGQYYLVSGNGLSLNDQVKSDSVAYKIAKIDNTDHFCIQRADDDRIADGNWHGNPFTFYGKDVPTTTGGNNCYHFMPATIKGAPSPTAMVQYNYIYNDAVKYTQKVAVYVDSEFPNYTFSLPYGVVASAKLEGKVDKDTVVKVNLTDELPFEYVESLEDYENLSEVDEDGCWKWYHLILHSSYNQVLCLGDETNLVDASKKVVDEANEDAYSWAFVGNPFDGFKVVNKAAGSAKGLKAGADGGYVDADAEVLKLTASSYAEDGFFMQSTTGTKKECFNYQNGKLMYWGSPDAGSTFQVELRQTEAQKLTALKFQFMESLGQKMGNGEIAFMGEPGLGQYPYSAYLELMEVFDAIETREELEAAIAAFEATKKLPVFTIDGVINYAEGKSIYENAAGKLYFKETDLSDGSMLWTFDMFENVVGVTNVVVKNFASGKLFNGADTVRITETNPAIEDDGIFLFYAKTYYPVHAQAENQVITEWGDEAATSGSAWKFTYVGDTYSLCDLDEAYPTGAQGWVEATYTDPNTGESVPLLSNADLKEEFDGGPARWTIRNGYSETNYDNIGVVKYDAPNGVVTFVATQEQLDAEAPAASLFQNQLYFDPGKYRLTGKAYHKGATNAKMFIGKLDYSENILDTVYKVAVPEAAAFGGDLLIEFTISEEAAYDEYVIGYSCEFENAGDSLVVGGFKFEMFGNETSTIAKDFVEVLGDTIRGFASLQRVQEGFSLFETMYAEYNELLNEMNALSQAIADGKALKAKVEKAIVDMNTMTLNVDTVLNYARSDEYFAATDSAFSKQMPNFMKESAAYKMIAAAYDAAMDYSKVTTIEQLEANVAAINDSIAKALAMVPDAISLDKKEAELGAIGATVQLTATITAESENADKSVFWVSENPEVATVDAQGVVTAVSEGTAYIVAYSIHKNINAVCEVYVEVIEPAAVTLDKAEATLTEAGATVQLTATVTPADAADKTITWTTSDEKVATVDEDGLVTAVANGTATITATTVNGKTATCTVTVNIAPEDDNDDTEGDEDDTEGDKEDEDNGIDNLEVDVNTVIYDIHGRRVMKMEKGLYIVNGKKVLVK